MAPSSCLAAVVAAVMIIGCGGPPPDSPVVGQVSGTATAVLAASARDNPRTRPGLNALVRQDPAPSASVRTPVQQNTPPAALLTTTTDGSCVASDSHSNMAASPSAASPSNERVGAACVRRNVQHGREVPGRALPDVAAPLQAEEFGIEQPGDDMAPMTYTLADLENEPGHAHELWMEQGIQEVMEFDTR